ncbi:MAG: hypothetical protein FK731_00625 [Asgard group archaeon]|nr:hypothetical protein [Asgard group archaeon]
MTLHRKKIHSISNTSDNFSINNLKSFQGKSLNYHRKLQSFIERIKKQKADLSNRTLIIVPGYSVSNPPKIGDHRHYIKSLKYHEKMNPNGYKHIFVFDLYSKKDGRCNFKLNIPQLAHELYKSINTKRDNWMFALNGEIDFIGASMGGLIVRKFIQLFALNDNQLFTNWGILQIKNVILIATPNHGCRIVDRLQSPFIQFILRLFYGKKNFSKSEQFQQIAKGNINVYGKFLGLFKTKFSNKNIFLEELNSSDISSSSIRWITIRGTKWKWYSSLLYNRNEKNDGVVKSTSVMLDGAENIADMDLEMNISWDHRDLYESESICKLLFGLLTLNLKLNDYLYLNQLLEIQNKISYRHRSWTYLMNKIVLNANLRNNKFNSGYSK